MALTHAGIVHQPPGQSTLAYLPIEEVIIRAWVVDVSARVVLTQVFRNESERPTARAKYIFPLLERSAVCAFELQHADGRVIVGSVQESEVAEQTFETAVASGKTAALVERVTDDIFAISVGSIPAREQVTSKITFIMDLLDEGLRDHVRLQLPLTIFGRYGPLPEAMVGAASASNTTRVDIKVYVQTSDTIHRIRSLTHPIKVSGYNTRDERKSQRRMSASWASRTFVTGDFVLTIYADGLDKPRCFAEDAKSTYGTTGMQLTLVPSFKTLRTASQEYIFVIDISHSMTGPRLETAKHTLLMLLRLTPSTQTIFNILCFDSNVWPLCGWSTSRDFGRDSLREAVARVQALTIDVGGTEITKALEAAINSRRNDRPTAIFLLTDGEVYDIGGPMGVVADAVRNASPDAPLRVFVLGIGSPASAVCEGIARAGNGECLLAASHESILEKCARLFNAARTMKIENVEVDWGVQPTSRATQPKKSHLVNSVGMLVLEPLPTLQQVPHVLTKISAGVRFTVFSIISSGQIPSSIKLFTKFQGVDEPMEWVVSVTEVKPFKDSKCEIPLIHTLAARKLITELRECRTPLPAVVNAVEASDDEIRKAAIVRLGLGYQLISQYTSFVAVGDEDTGWMKTRRQLHSSPRRVNGNQDANQDEDDGILGTFLNGLTSAFLFVSSMLGGPVSDPRSTSGGRPENIPGAYVDSESDQDDRRPRGRTPRSTGQGIPRRDSTDTLSSLSSLGTSCTSCWTSSRSPSPEDPIVRAPSPEFEFVHAAGVPCTPHTTTPQASFSPDVSSASPLTITADAYQVSQLIDYEGWFSPAAELAQIVGSEILEKADELGVDERLWATLVAVAYLKKHLEKEPYLLDTILEKTGDFVRGTHARERGKLQGDFEDMIRYASELLEAGQGKLDQ